MDKLNIVSCVNRRFAGTIFFLLSMLLLCQEETYAQNAKIDSLRTELSIAKEDTSKAITLYYLAVQLRRASEFEESIRVSQETLELSKKLYYKLGELSAFNNLGIIYEKKAELGRSLDYHSKSLKISTEENYAKGMANSYMNMGVVYQLQGQHKEALEVYFKCLGLMEKSGNQLGIIQSYNNIAIVYEHQNLFDEALKFYFEALKISEQINSPEQSAFLYGNIGVIYNYKRELEKALTYFSKALAFAIENEKKEQVASISNNIGFIYEQQNKYEAALEKYNYALNLSKEVGNISLFANNYINIGSVQSRMRKFADARIAINTGLEIAKSNGLMFVTKEAYEYLSRLDSLEGNYYSALKNYKTYTIYKDSLLNEDNNKQISGMRTKYDTEKKEQEIKLLTHENLLKQTESEKKDLQIRQRLQQILLLDREKKIKDFQLTEQQSEIEKKNLYALKKESELKEQTLISQARESEVSILNKDKVIQKKELTRQKMMRNGFIGGFAFVLIFAGVFLKQRNKISIERQRSENLLLNILPAEVAEELKNKGKAEAKDHDLVTILFTDFKEFTQTSEKMSAKDLVNELNTCFEAFDMIIEKHGIEKIKTIGDSYMAAGGIPVPHNDSATHVVNAAIALNDFVMKRKLIRDKEGLPSFEMRIGIHSGPVVSGIVGVKKFQYDIWGDTVNTASRIESAGEPGKINVSAATYELIKDKFECSYRGEIDAKGKGKLKMYFVECDSAV